MPSRSLAPVAFLTALALAACGTPQRSDEEEACTPDCTDRACGDDGCGGSCGSCAGDTPRCANHVCKAACTPRCAGKQCGDDGCEGTCGSCINGMTCTVLGLCAAPSDGCSKGCPAGNYCDTTANSCKAGCIEDANCPAGKSCDFHTHECVPKPELCNGVDDDNDGRTDEDFPQKGQPCDGPDADQCATGTWACAPDGHSLVCQGDTVKRELCNGIDDDCDGQVDEDFPQKGQKCDGTDADTCANGTFACSPDGRGVVCEGDAPKVEVCNGVDDDCDGNTDTAVMTRSLSLPNATDIVASEFKGDSLTVVTRTATGAQVFSGSPANLQVRDSTATTYLQDAAIENGVVAGLFSNTSASVWWGTPGAMRQEALTGGFTLTAQKRDMGGTIGLVDGQPVAMRVAEFSGTSSAQVERVAYRWTGSGFAAQSLYKHSYMGGNTDRGAIAGLGSGRAVALVRDEWNNNYYQGMNIKCAWFALASGTWTAGDTDAMCDPVAGPLAIGSSAWAVTEPWGGQPDTLVQASNTGRAQSSSSLPSPQGTTRMSLVADGKGRAHLVWMNPTSRAVEQKVVAGGSSTVSTLQATLGQNSFFVAGADGDELFVITYDQTTWGGPLSNVKLTRQLVCH